MNRAGRGAVVLAGLSLGAASLAARISFAGGDEKEAPESVAQSAEARSALDSIAKSLHEEEWGEAFDAAKDLLKKHASELVAIGGADADRTRDGGKLLGLHLTCGAALRRTLASIPDAGVQGLRKRFESWTDRGVLEAAFEKGDTRALEGIADQFFPLVEGAKALLAAGDAYKRRGDLVAAWVAWQDVLALHRDEASREAAAAKLIAVLPEWKDARAARSLLESLESAKLANKEALTKRANDALESLEDAELAPCSFDDSGGTGAFPKARPPSAVLARMDLPDVPKTLDWRHEVDVQRQQLSLPNVRRLLTGSAAVPGTLLVHVGRAILAFDPESGELAWSTGGTKSLASYFDGIEKSTALARFGIAVSGSAAYATLRAKTTGPESTYPVGRLLKIDLRDGHEGEILWDSQRVAADDERPSGKKSKNDEKHEKADRGKEARGGDDDDDEVHLSYVGRPLAAGGRVLVGAWNAETPSETYVAALDAASGRLVFKVKLASTEPFAAQDRNRWQAAQPRALPCPALALAEGALVAVSGNGCAAALDPETGRVLWAHTYDRDEFRQAQAWRRTPREDAIAVGHVPNAPLAFGDRALVLPQDSSRMFIFRITDGKLLGKHGRNGYEHVLGVAKQTIVLEGDSEVAGFQLADKGTSLECVWSETLHRSKALGRGAIVGKWAYVPLEDELVAFRASNGEKREVLTWESPKREAGDLVVGGGRFYTVSARYAHSFKEEP
jgi:outer membrane protein assembly factor BamB